MFALDVYCMLVLASLFDPVGRSIVKIGGVLGHRRLSPRLYGLQKVLQVCTSVPGSIYRAGLSLDLNL